MRITMINFFLLSVIFCARPGFCGDEGLVGYWRFNEGQGALVNDSSSNGNHGKIYGSKAWVTGMEGAALQFNNDGSYVEIPHSPSLDIKEALTVVAWIKIDQNVNAGKKADIFKKNWDCTFCWDDRPVSVWRHPAFRQLTWRLFTGGQERAIIAEDALATNNAWHCVAASFSTRASHPQQKLYVNGRLVSQNMPFYNNNSVLAAYKHIPMSTNSFPLQIGGGICMLDEIRVYNRLLSDKEIYDLYQALIKKE